MEIGEPHAFLGEAVAVRGGCLAAGVGEVAIAEVVGQDVYHVGMFAQGGNGRDHNPFGFSLWMAGGGVKGGMTYGATDEYGYKAVDKKLEIHDLHATMLHLLGMNHKKLTIRFSSRDMRLTDVHGEVIKDILA